MLTKCVYFEIGKLSFLQVNKGGLKIDPCGTTRIYFRSSLFTLYINDLSNITNNFKTVMYADPLFANLETFQQKQCENYINEELITLSNG